MANEKDHSALITEMIAAQATQREKIDNIEEDCKEIKDCLLGNGKIGLVVRTDRLEQTERGRSKILWTLFGLVIAVSLKILADVFSFQLHQ